MEKKILVTYASKYGATKEIAEKIGEGLNKRVWMQMFCLLEASGIPRLTRP